MENSFTAADAADATVTVETAADAKVVTAVRSTEMTVAADAIKR